MSDIVVTTPKSEVENAAREAAELIAAGGGRFFRALRSRPKRLEEGDRIFYVEDSFVRGCGTVDEIRTGGDRCDLTDRYWDGAVAVYFSAMSWTWIRPIPMRGFQGWRYATAELLNQVEHAGGWLDPMPEAP